MRTPDDFKKSRWATSGLWGTPGWVGLLLCVAVIIAVGFVLDAVTR